MASLKIEKTGVGVDVNVGVDVVVGVIVLVAVGVGVAVSCRPSNCPGPHDVSARLTTTRLMRTMW